MIFAFICGWFRVAVIVSLLPMAAVFYVRSVRNKGGRFLGRSMFMIETLILMILMMILKTFPVVFRAQGAY